MQIYLNNWVNMVVLGSLWKDMLRPDEAEKAFREALAIFREFVKTSLSAYERHIAFTQHNLGLLYQETQRYEESEKAYSADNIDKCLKGQKGID